MLLQQNGAGPLGGCISKAVNYNSGDCNNQKWRIPNGIRVSEHLYSLEHLISGLAFVRLECPDHCTKKKRKWEIQKEKRQKGNNWGGGEG